MTEFLNLFADASLTPQNMAFAAAAIFFAGALRAYAGFGFALAGVPLLAMSVGPAAAVPMILALEILSGLQMLPKVRHQADWKSIWLILPTAVLAAPLGVYLLVALSADALRIFIALTLLGAVALMASGLKLPARLPLPATLAIGGVSGLLAGSTAMAGPPVLLYFLGRGDTPAAARASMFMYFSLTGATTLIVGMLSGVVTLPMMLLTLMLAPALFVSNIAGHWLFHAMGDRHYRPIALTLLAVIALVTLWRAIL
ncbi:MAG: sulfite exporter TauE/SafE family protein [Parvibaculum sp.]